MVYFVVGIFGLMAPVAMLMGALNLAAWILGPFEAVARHQKHRHQFMLADFLSLFFLVQLPLAGVHSCLSSFPLSVKLVLDTMGGLTCSALWLMNVKRLDKAGVRCGSHRVIFLTFVTPIAYLGTLAFVTAAACLAMCLLVPGGNQSIAWFLLACSGLMLSFMVAAGFVRRMVSQREVPERASRDNSGNHHALTISCRLE